MSECLSTLAVLVALLSAGVAALALSGRVVFKMAARNFARRRAQSAIVVAGLMVGTAIISASLVVGDTMRYIFEVETYRSLGEVDHEIYGTGPTGETLFFNESVYETVRERLEDVEGIEAVAPAVLTPVSVLNPRTRLAEPSVSLCGLSSAVMRASAFGDLDGGGLYTDYLGPGEVVLNSRLAEGLEARRGDALTLTLGVPSTTRPLAKDIIKINCTVARIVQERGLYGKANYGQTKTLFLELQAAQELLRRPGQINYILVSDEGDMYGGEAWSPRVNGTIREALDEAVGMREVGLELALTGGELALSSVIGYFPYGYALPLVRGAEAVGARVTVAAAVLVETVGGSPSGGALLIGVNTSDPAYPVVGEGVAYLLPERAAALNATNGSALPVSAVGMDGTLRAMNLTVEVLPPGVEAALPPELRGRALGFIGISTAQNLITGGAYGAEMVSRVSVYGVELPVLQALSASVRAELDGMIRAKDVGLGVHDVKYDGLRTARAGGDAIGQIFMIFSIFSIIAGIVLIINIFVMLSEERRSEMGMARAIGMRRRELVRMYLFEGTLYVFLASAVGAVAGLGLGYLLILSFGVIFAGGSQFPFYFRPESVLTAFCAGVLITFATIYLASARAARLNIIRAIRRLPEPRGARAMRSDIQYGALMLAAGVLLTLYAALGRVAWAWLAGPGLLFLGLGALAYKWVSLRAAMTFSSVAILAWVFNPFPLPLVTEAAAEGAGLDMFVVSGVFLVLAGVILVMFNSDLLLAALQSSLGRQRAARATLKIAISYPMNRKWRTGMTLAMFALIIFTVTVIAMIAAMQASMMENMRMEQSGGYDIIGFASPSTPLQNLTIDALPPGLKERDIRQLQTLSAATVALVDYDARGGGGGEGLGPSVPYGGRFTQLYGAGGDFLERNGFPLEERDRNYTSDRECWAALRNNRSLCIIDGTRLRPASIQAGPSFGGAAPGAYVGGTVTVTDIQGQNRTRALRVIGVMHQMYFFQGVVVQRDVVEREYGGVERVLLVELGPGEDVDGATKDFKRAFLDNGLVALDIGAIMALVTTAVTNVMYLMEGFLAIGLLIGIAGIGILSYRSVIERRQQIGMMRALGYTRKMVAGAFIIETSFITILATVVGILLGIGIGWQIFDGGGYRELGASFGIPWVNIAVIAGGAYLATILFTFYPSLMAARVPPAEALRYVE
ncbi:MAG: ABC transporter permease [Thermoplasmatota archaeon]